MQTTKSKRLTVDVNSGTVGFQIAPMIDVVFVIMLFFMVMAGAVKRENELNTTLPGDADNPGSPANLVDEVIVTIAEDGEISLNDDPVDNKTSKTLPQLTSALTRLKLSSDNAKSLMALTIASEEKAKYSRTIDVLNACAAAHVVFFNFTVS